MQGQKDFKPKLFYHVQLEQLVPDDHELRRIFKIIDFETIRSKVRDKYSHTGQPSVDPVVIIKMLFLGYYYGISSERKLSKEIIVNNAYRWFLGYDLDETPPTHSVLSKARSRYGLEIFQSFFDQIVGQCMKAGLVSGKRAFLDYTLIEANASIESLMPRMQVMTPSEYTAQIMKEEVKSVSDFSDPKPPSQEKQNFNERMVSKTDPDATYVGRGKKSGLNYEGHYLVDGQNQIIVGVTTTDTVGNAGNDAPELMQRALFRHGLKFDSLCADAEYGTQSVYAFLENQGIIPYIPVARSGQNRMEKHFLKSAFEYQEEKDFYLCPAGKALERIAVDRATQQISYRNKSGHCASCSLRSQCTNNKKGRLIKRLFYEELVKRAKARMETPEYLKQMKARRFVVEPLYSEAKDCHGLRRAKYRRLWRVGIQVLWTATIQNMKRLIKTAGRSPGLSNGNLGVPLSQYFMNLFGLLVSRLNYQRTLTASFLV